MTSRHEKKMPGYYEMAEIICRLMGGDDTLLRKFHAQHKDGGDIEPDYEIYKQEVIARQEAKQRKTCPRCNCPI